MYVWKIYIIQDDVFNNNSVKSSTFNCNSAVNIIGKYYNAVFSLSFYMTLSFYVEIEVKQ